MTKKKANTVLIIIIIVLAVLLVVAIAVGAYFWGKNRSNATSSPTPTKTASVSSSPTKTATPNQTTTTSTQAEETPQQVVENFMKYTLGTLPGASINYDKARDYLSDTMQAQYSGEGWVPRFYGIQDGPDSVVFKFENQTEDGVVLRYDALWGNEVGIGWAFTMAKDGNKWYIDGFSNTVQ